MKRITIVGAGLAGLALGNALQRAGIATTIHEAGGLPRHRVCGEFLCGRGAEALNQLGLRSVLTDAIQHRQIHWYLHGKRILQSTLPSPAYGISRHRLDDQLAQHFREQGGRLIEHSRVPQSNVTEGIVLCCGRQATTSDWIGLKLHCTQLHTHADLELHLGKNAYLGLSAVEDGRVNACALLKRRPELKVTRDDRLPSYLEACGLSAVAKRIRAGGIDPESHAGVAGIVFSHKPMAHAKNLRLGDAYSVIPPFTGNGMSIALESAEIALPELLSYARGKQPWSTAVATIRKSCDVRFRPRLRAAQRLHPWISRPARQRTLATLCRCQLLPFRFLYKLTH
jgi:2-polyprenyl-6-methoxyphenol hydroxylase-like FAD-dependent oxidoreductase